MSVMLRRPPAAAKVPNRRRRGGGDHVDFAGARRPLRLNDAHVTHAFLALAACAAALAASPASADDYSTDWARSSKSEARLVAGAPGRSRRRNAPRAGRDHLLAQSRRRGRAAALRLYRLGQSRARRTRLSGAQPHRRADGSQAFGYQDDVVFPIAVAPPTPAKPVTLALQLDYAVCEKLCIPAKATLKLTSAVSRREPLCRDARRRERRRRRARPTLLGARRRTRRRLARTPGACALPAEPGAERDLFIEAPDGWWLTTKADRERDGRAHCFAHRAA